MVKDGQIFLTAIIFCCQAVKAGKKWEILSTTHDSYLYIASCLYIDTEGSGESVLECMAGTFHSVVDGAITQGHGKC